LPIKTWDSMRLPPVCWPMQAQSRAVLNCNGGLQKERVSSYACTYIHRRFVDNGWWRVVQTTWPVPSHLYCTIGHCTCSHFPCNDGACYQDAPRSEQSVIVLDGLCFAPPDDACVARGTPRSRCATALQLLPKDSFRCQHESQVISPLAM